MNKTREQLKEQIAELQQQLTKARIEGSLQKAYDLQDEIDELQKQLQMINRAA
jgi:excinuclease UvrABC helicase subunit UvrB